MKHGTIYYAQTDMFRLYIASSIRYHHQIELPEITRVFFVARFYRASSARRRISDGGVIKFPKTRRGERFPWRWRENVSREVKEKKEKKK